MKLAVMQPYLFPYLGFYSLAASVDALVIRDTAQFPKGGWVNRNRMEYRHGVDWFTIPLEGSPFDSEIRHKCISRSWSPKTLRNRIEPSLFGAENRRLVLDILDDIRPRDRTAALPLLDVLRDTLSSTFKAVGIGCEVILESALDLEPLAGQSGVIEICNKIGALSYHNLPGGRALYSKSQFAEMGLKLRFVESNLSEYTRNRRSWIPALSILDSLSQVGPVATKQLVFNDYTLD